MSYAPDPAAQRAAQEAQDEAEAAIRRRLDAQATASLKPFERKLLGVLEDIRDAVQSPDPGPLLVTIDPAASNELCERVRAKLPEGSLLTGPNYPILDVRPLAGVPITNVTNLVDRDALDATICRVCGLSELLDAAPDDLGEAITAAAAAIASAAPGTPTSAVEHYAEVAIDAALKWVAHRDDETPSDRAEVQDGAAGGGQNPPAEHPEQ
ncbi:MULTISPECIES: hypothetical protein [Mycolicibacterium]|uniref:Uncharacterized protein n=2 Tax=Mycolicibacterium TaxID=1866885 RepID=A0AAE4VCI8_MYCFO|nr:MULTISPECIES: hypothetical protein [Mycolicibacterium]KLI05833.1 hypothetical protein AA982_23090 [Mycolicibacterium senegalense]KLO54117.1 hypothetical protein ABW05_24260 [Mycolicibacterium senegalense]KLO54180.1 hypothetical protein ABW05_24675 [Mycolicibacterium senegalense]MDV7192645.1 hypothetical protein [Mycolicibacterium fortuitum]MDV7205546.1 hypothetical protein [Mycolicibacterium fortuitum]